MLAIKKLQFDPFITILSFVILFFGFLIFFSASLGVMARYEEKFFSIIQNQFLFGVLLGSLAFFLGVIIPEKVLRLLSPFFYLLSISLCALVLIPHFGIMYGGGRRWLSIFGLQFQPSETLKYGSVMILSSYYYYFWSKLQDMRWRVLPILFLLGASLLVLIEPDLGTTAIVVSGFCGVFVLTFSKWKDLLLLFLLLVIGGTGFYMYYPHAKERVNTFFNPDKDTQQTSYQSRQAIISLGAGGIWGDGYGKSIQKYYHLPEPIGDSIFSVIGEEFGFVGCLVILLLIITLCLRLLFLANRIKDPFSKGILFGTSVIILTQTFLNAGSASAATPFTGVPLPLISHGSTSIIITMGILGLCAQIGGKNHLIS